MAVEFELKGMDEVLKKFDAMTVEVQKKGGRAALRRAAQLVRNTARRNALGLDDPESSAVIAKNITERWSNQYNRRTGDLMFRVGVLGGVFGKLNGDQTGVYGDKYTKKTRKRGAVISGPGGDTRHWGYLEFGTEKMAARPFMLPALEKNIDQIVSTFSINLDAALDRAIKNASK